MPTSPVPSVSGALTLANAARSFSGTSRAGHTCRNTWLLSSRFLRPACARRSDSRHAASTRSATGNDVTLPSASRTGVASRTSASATIRSSAGLSGDTRWNRYTPSAAGTRVPLKFFSRHRSSRWPVSGCMARMTRSSARPCAPCVRGRNVNCRTSGACGLEQTVTVTRRPAARLARSCRAARSSSEIRSGSSGASAHAR